MSGAFDPYHKWLGILPRHQPPNHYRLLGLEPFEDDTQVIEAAADRQFSFLRRYQSGENAAACQQLLNEVARARLCLLKPASKASYDAELRHALETPSFSIDIDTSEQRPVRRGKKFPTTAIVAGAMALAGIVAIAIFATSEKKDHKVANGNKRAKVELPRDEVANSDGDSTNGKQKSAMRSSAAEAVVDSPAFTDKRAEGNLDSTSLKREDSAIATAPTNKKPDTPSAMPLKSEETNPDADPNSPLVNEGLLTTGATPVPGDAFLLTASTKIHEDFAAEYVKAKKDSEKSVLAGKIGKLALQATDDPAAKYAAIDEARKLAIDAGELRQATSFVDTQCLEFKVDPAELRFVTFKAIAPKLKNPPANQLFTELALPLVDQLIQTERYLQAGELAGLAGQAATKSKDKTLQKDALETRREAHALAEEFQAAEKARTTLEGNPADADARRIWGEWLCLRKQKWAEGLGVLSGARDEVLKELAERDLRIPEETEMLHLGTDWLDYAKSGKGRAEFAERALHWLGKAHARANNQEKPPIETALEEAVKVREGTSFLIPLLNQIEPKAAQGKVKDSDENPHDGGERFKDTPAQRGILIGLNCTMGPVADSTAFLGIQPIYATRFGIRTGDWHGSAEGQLVEVRAKPGYAVSGLRCQSSNGLDTLQLAFSRITKSGLNLKRTYRSQVINGPRRNDSTETIISLSASPIVGIFGHVDSHVLGLGVTTVK
jgi:hypothetical protein